MSYSGVLDHKCNNCGSVLKFNPAIQKWECEFCKSIFTEEQLKKGEELNNDATIDRLEKDNHGMDLYICPNCGAQIVADENTSATFCIYCKNTAILKNKLVGEFNPSLIIPFKTTKEDAIKAFVDFSNGKPLIPDVFTSRESIEEIKGIYIPFWLFDYNIYSNVEGTATESTSWTNRSYRYTKTNTYQVEVSGDMNFKRVPVDGSTRFDNAIMNSIEPFDYGELRKFNYSYLSGFFAEKYDVDSNTASYDAVNREVNSAKKELEKKVKHQSFSVTKTEHMERQLNLDYVLLPVWLLNIKYENELYTFAMNGQTGEMIGNAPIDKKKARKFFISHFLKIFIVFFVIALIIFIGGIL